MAYFILTGKSGNDDISLYLLDTSPAGLVAIASQADICPAIGQVQGRYV